MLSEKTALYEPGIGPHRTCQSSALRRPASSLVKDKFLCLLATQYITVVIAAQTRGEGEQVEGETVHTANGKPP